MGSNNVRAAIIIPTLNRGKVLIDTIESVLKLKPLPDEFWVIDQTAQHEPEVELYLKNIQKRGVKVVKLPEPGVCFARNLGAALSSADILIYLDDDVIVENLAFVENHKRNYLDAEIDAVQGHLLENEASRADGRETDKVEPDSAQRADNIKTFVTANASIRRNVLLKIGGFDEGFSGRTYANEDGDLGQRLFNDGYRIVYDPASSLIHLKAPSGGNRILGRDSFPEWTRSVTFFQFTLRHFSGWGCIWRMLYIFRLITFRKENVSEPWCLPGALLHALYALSVAITRHRAGFKSSLVNPGVDYLRLEYAHKEC